MHLNLNGGHYGEESDEGFEGRQVQRQVRRQEGVSRLLTKFGLCP